MGVYEWKTNNRNKTSTLENVLTKVFVPSVEETRTQIGQFLEEAANILRAQEEEEKKEKDKNKKEKPKKEKVKRKKAKKEAKKEEPKKEEPKKEETKEDYDYIKNKDKVIKLIGYISADIRNDWTDGDNDRYYAMIELAEKINDYDIITELHKVHRSFVDWRDGRVYRDEFSYYNDGLDLNELDDFLIEKYKPCFRCWEPRY